MVFAVTNSFKANKESSVPYPEAFDPPNGKRGSELVILLILTVPDSRFSIKNNWRSYLLSKLNWKVPNIIRNL
jgi:hypothetical protein